MYNSGFTNLLASVCILTSGVIALAQAQPDPPIAKYPVRQIELPGMVYNAGIGDWVITKKNAGVIFTLDYNAYTAICRLLKYQLNLNGKVLSLGEIYKPREEGGGVYTLDAVWLGKVGGGQFPTAAGREWGLLFFGYCDEWYPERMVLAVAKFSDHGDILDGPHTLLEVEKPDDHDPYLAWSKVAVGRGPDGFAVIFTVTLRRNSYPYGNIATRTFFMETDFHGNLKGEVTEIPTPGGFYMKRLGVYTPHWNGKRWLAPAVRVRHYDGPVTIDTEGMDFYVMEISPKSAANAKIRFRKLESSDVGYEFASEYGGSPFRFPHFIPDSYASAVSGNARPTAKALPQKLFYCHRTYVPEEEVVMDFYSDKYYIQGVNKRGKKVGDPLEVEIPQWNHNITLQQDEEMTSFHLRISRPIPSGDKRLLLAQTRTIELLTMDGSFKNYRRFNQYCLYAVDPDTGEVVTLARGGNIDSVLYIDGSGCAPIVRWFNDRVAVVNESLRRDKPYEYLNYFTIFNKNILKEK